VAVARRCMQECHQRQRLKHCDEQVPHRCGYSISSRGWLWHLTPCAARPARSVTLGDEEARRRGGRKSQQERASPPTFDAAVELLGRRRWRVHTDLAAAVDRLLAGAAQRQFCFFSRKAVTVAAKKHCDRGRGGCPVQHATSPDGSPASELVTPAWCPVACTGRACLNGGAGPAPPLSPHQAARAATPAAPLSAPVCAQRARRAAGC